jgi:hypothetical protein
MSQSLPEVHGPLSWLVRGSPCIGWPTEVGMPRKSLIPDRATWLQDANSLLVSAFCNLCLLIALGLLSVAGSDGWSGVKLLVNLGDGPDSPVVDDSPIQDEIKLEVSAEAAAAVGPTLLFEKPAISTIDLAALASPVEKSALFSGLDGTALGGGRVGEGTVAKASTEFFGIGGYGQTFVYVVDCSDSMNERGKFDRARYELLQSIEQLQKDQRYYVIFYNSKAHPMNAERPVRAAAAQIAETTRWIHEAEASGGTNPLPALLIALSMRPDAIYFLSDGQFDPQTIRELRIRNRTNLRLHTRTIPIHTIAFFDRFAEGLMRAIARNSGGEFRFVNR